MSDDHDQNSAFVGKRVSYPVLSTTRFLFVGVSVISLLVCGAGGVLHYRKIAPGNPWQVIGWLLGMLFFLSAFAPAPRELGRHLRTSLNRKMLFFIFWIVIFIV